MPLTLAVWGAKSGRGAAREREVTGDLDLCGSLHLLRGLQNWHVRVRFVTPERKQKD